MAAAEADIDDSIKRKRFRVSLKNGYTQKKLGILVPPGHTPQRIRIKPIPVDGEGVRNISHPNCFAPSLILFEIFPQTNLSARM